MKLVALFSDVWTFLLIYGGYFFPKKACAIPTNGSLCKKRCVSATSVVSSFSAWLWLVVIRPWQGEKWGFQGPGTKIDVIEMDLKVAKSLVHHDVRLVRILSADSVIPSRFLPKTRNFPQWCELRKYCEAAEKMVVCEAANFWKIRKFSKVPPPTLDESWRACTWDTIT